MDRMDNFMDRMDNLIVDKCTDYFKDNFSNRLLQYGHPLRKCQYSVDFNTKVFVSKENDLVLDFERISGWTFKTGYECTFKTGYNCTFKTGNNCTFKTGHDCIFDTGYNCTFNTGEYCTFDTGYDCTFLIWDINTCKFKIYDGLSTILDRRDRQAYKLTREFIALQKIKNG